MSSSSSADPRLADKVYGGTFEAANVNNPRTLIASWVPEGSRVLEIGPGNGVVGRWLRTSKRCRVSAVEVVPQAAALLGDAFDAVIVGNIEEPRILTEAAALGPFDAILFADVLEHLVDPWQVLRSVAPLLTATGRVLTSFPNVAHWTARLNLLRGRFDYTDGYLMDRTHLRWFTFRSAQELAAQSGYCVVALEAVYKPRFFRFWKTLNGYQIVMNLAPQ